MSIMVNSNDIRNHIDDCTLCGPVKDEYIHPNGFSRTPNAEIIRRVISVHCHEDKIRKMVMDIIA